MAMICSRVNGTAGLPHQRVARPRRPGRTLYVQGWPFTGSLMASSPAPGCTAVARARWPGPRGPARSSRWSFPKPAVRRRARCTSRSCQWPAGRPGLGASSSLLLSALHRELVPLLVRRDGAQGLRDRGRAALVRQRVALGTAHFERDVLDRWELGLRHGMIPGTIRERYPSEENRLK